MTSTPATPSPELLDTERRLAALPPAWCTATLHATATGAAERAAFAREASQRLATAREAVEAAMAALDIDELERATSRLTVATPLVTALPVAADIHDADALAIAGADLRAATDAITADPTLAVEMERAAWQTWPTSWRAGDAPQPVELPSETALRARLDAWRRDRNGILAAVGRWPAGGDTLTELEVAASLVEQARHIAAAGDALVADVHHANHLRVAGGMEWDATPSAIAHSDSFDSPELRALRHHRAAHRQVVNA